MRRELSPPCLALLELLTQRCEAAMKTGYGSRLGLRNAECVEDPSLLGAVQQGLMLMLPV